MENTKHILKTKEVFAGKAIFEIPDDVVREFLPPGYLNKMMAMPVTKTVQDSEGNNLLTIVIHLTPADPNTYTNFSAKAVFLPSKNLTERITRNDEIPFCSLNLFPEGQNTTIKDTVQICGHDFLAEPKGLNAHVFPSVMAVKDLFSPWVLTLEYSLTFREFCQEEKPTPKLKKKVAAAFEPVDRERHDKLSDVTVKVGEDSIRCHKIQLAKRSKIFEAMFNHDLEENISGEVEIKDFDFQTVKDFIHFLYDGRMENEASYNTSILGIATKYDVQILKELCEERLSAALDHSNAIECWIASDLYQATNLKKSVLAYIVKHWDKKDEFEGYQEVFKDHTHLLIELLKLKK